MCSKFFAATKQIEELAKDAMFFEKESKRTNEKIYRVIERVKEMSEKEHKQEH